MPASDYESLIREILQILTRHEVRTWKDRATEWLLSLPRADDRPAAAWAAHAQTVLQPISRTNPGFIGGGQTAGGAPEFVVPNGPIPPGATTTIVGP
jgi:hypothetical protein